MMNNRIRELAKKSGFSLDANHIYTAKLEHLPITENMEKFAELIVRECQFAIVSRTGLPKHERKLYNDVLKEHFGVSE